MTTTQGQIMAQQRADLAVVKFVEEVATTGHIKRGNL